MFLIFYPAEDIAQKHAAVAIEKGQAWRSPGTATFDAGFSDLNRVQRSRQASLRAAKLNLAYCKVRSDPMVSNAFTSNYRSHIYVAGVHLGEISVDLLLNAMMSSS